MIKRDKVRFATDPRKKIKLGYKGKSKEGKEIPKKTDYFVLVSPETGEVYFPELVEFYGDKPKSLFVTFPSNNPADFYTDNYVRYRGSVKTRVCDGITCEHFADEEIDGFTYKAGTETDCVCNHHKLFDLAKKEDKDLTPGEKELKKKCCRPVMMLKALILNPKTKMPISPLCYLFESSSINSCENIYGELYRTEPDGGTIPKYSRYAGYPFVLSVKIVKQPGKEFPIMSLYPYLDPEMLIEYQMNFQMQLGNGKEVKQIEAKTDTKEAKKQVAKSKKEKEKEIAKTIQKPEPEEAKYEVKKTFEEMRIELGNSMSYKELLDKVNEIKKEYPLMTDEQKKQMNNTYSETHSNISAALKDAEAKKK